jgi:hypothetical protein
VDVSAVGRRLLHTINYCETVDEISWPGKPKDSEKSIFDATLSTSNPTLSNLGSTISYINKRKVLHSISYHYLGLLVTTS